MRQIFTSVPYILPEEPAETAAICKARGTERSVKKGEVLKRGGEHARLYFILRGLAAYFVAEELTGRGTIMALIPPGRVAGDLTANIGNSCNVTTRMLTAGAVLSVPPDAISEAMREHPELSQTVVKNVIAKEECHLEGMIANFTLPPAQRLKVLFRAALGADPLDDSVPWYELPWELSAQTVGQIVNLNRVSVARLISAWIKGGLLKRAGRKLCVRPSLFNDVYDWEKANADAVRPRWVSPSAGQRKG
ncbi:MAG: hypothetical protein ACFWTZ_02270 [Burkholderia sp.]|jgi:CRP-like cAMP-binding protein